MCLVFPLLDLALQQGSHHLMQIGMGLWRAALSNWLVLSAS
jgi:hypothetical protein